MSGFALSASQLYRLHLELEINLELEIWLDQRQNNPSGQRRVVPANPAFPRGWLPAGVGPVQPLLPHPLHHEVAGHPADPAPLPHVQAGVEVQGVEERLQASHEGGTASLFYNYILGVWRLIVNSRGRKWQMIDWFCQSKFISWIAFSTKMIVILSQIDFNLWMWT